MEFYIYPYGSYKSARARVSLDYLNLIKNSNVDYLILGDSTAYYGIEPLELTRSSASAAMVAAPLFSNYNALKKLEQINIRKGIIISQTFIKDHYDLDIWGIFVPSKIYSLDDVLNIFCMGKVPNCSNFEKLVIHLKFFQARLHLTPYALHELYERVSYYNRSFNSLYISFFQIIKQNNGYFKNTHSAIADRRLYLTPFREHFSRPIQAVPTSEKIYLNKIIDYAKENKLVVHYVFMPTAAVPLGVNIDLYRESVRNYLKDVTGPNFKIIDGSVFEQNLKLDDFWDFTHLNNSGSKKFAAFLRIELGIDQPH